MSHFWSSTGKGYIEPKRTYQLIGIVDFIQPFLIQKMDKPSVTLKSKTVKKILTNGTIKTEHHYKSNYELNEITISAIDSYDETPNAGLNNADKLYKILSAGGYTLLSNELGSARGELRFPTFRILEISPRPRNELISSLNTVKSFTGNAASALASGGGFSDVVGGILDSATTAAEFSKQNVMGIYTLKDPIITSVNFGDGIGYDSDGMVQVGLTIKYSNFKYEKNFI